MTKNTIISICTITLGRESIYKMLETVLTQEIEQNYEINLILQGVVDKKRIKNLNAKNITVNIFNYPRGLPFGYYRDKSIENSSGSVIVWIDDDEWAMDNFWLRNLIRPILYDNKKAVTGGYFIPLGQGYLTDCVSLFGWPGGGAVGFEKMWKVSLDQTTKHICTGNFALLSSVARLLKSNHVDSIYGEDNALAVQISEMKIPIYFQKNATVFHVSRSFGEAFFWWAARAKSAHHYVKNNSYEENIKEKKLRFIKNIIKFDHFFPGKFFCLTIMFLIFLYYRLID